jgi:hypothetical protein
MDDRKIMKQIQAIIRFFMALFYLGAGIFLLLFSDNFKIDKVLLKLVGGTFLFYGVYRIYRACLSIYRLFISKEEDFE